MPNSVNSIWTSERVEKLKDLQARRWSCAQIAAELGCGISRNAVIGKLHRLGICGGDRAIPELERTRRSVIAKERKRGERNERRRERRRQFREENPLPRMIGQREFVPMVCTEVEPLGVSLFDLKEGACRYPDGEGAEITFCGHPKAVGRSYCLPHARLTLSSERCWTRGEMESNRRDRKAKFNQTLLEAAE